MRWMAESAFSSIKRTYGEYVSATKFQNMVKEMMLKVRSGTICLGEWHKQMGIIFGLLVMQQSKTNRIL